MISKVLLLRVYSKSARTRHLRDLKPPLYFGYISSLLDDDVYLIDQMNSGMPDRAVVEKLRMLNPDYVVMSGFSHDIDEMNKIIRQCRKSINIAIGHAASYLPEKLKGFDHIIKGEPEFRVRDIIRYGRSKSPKVQDDINDLPAYDLTLFPADKYMTLYPVRLYKKAKWGYLETSRGCPHDCTFCSCTIRTSMGKKVRLKSMINVKKELDNLKDSGVNIISVEDDNFTTSKRHVQDFCGLIKDYDLKWIAQARVDEIDEKIISTMAKSGCISLRFGIEELNPKILKKIKKTTRPENWKRSAENAIKACNRHNISVNAMFQLGLADQSIDDIRNCRNFAIEQDPDMIQLAYFTPYPGTKAYSIYGDKGSSGKSYHYDLISNFSGLSDDGLKQEYDDFYKKFYFRPIKLLRQYSKFGIFYIRNPRIWFRLFRMFSSY